MRLQRLLHQLLGLEYTRVVDCAFTDDGLVIPAAGTPITVDAVKALCAPSSSEIAVPPLAATAVDLAEYDALLDAQEAA